ncbi:MAG: hypothetical protein JWN30_1752 [Bacilli bacterium]|nr:hypothetical protein [Bacilli bacterium]
MLFMICSLQVGKNLPVLRADSTAEDNTEPAGKPVSADWPVSAEVQQNVAHISQDLGDFSDWKQAKVKLLYPAMDAAGRDLVAIYEVMTAQPGYLVVRVAGVSCSLVEFGHTLPSQWLTVNLANGDLLYYLGAGGLFCKHAASEEAVDLLSGDRLPEGTLKSVLRSTRVAQSNGRSRTSSTFRFQPVDTPDLPPESGLGILVTAATGSADQKEVLMHGGWVVQNFSTTSFQTAHAVKGVVTVENASKLPQVQFLKIQNVFLPAVRPFYASSEMEFSWVLAQADSM